MHLSDAVAVYTSSLIDSQNSACASEQRTEMRFDKIMDDINTLGAEYGIDREISCSNMKFVTTDFITMVTLKCMLHHPLYV